MFKKFGIILSVLCILVMGCGEKENQVFGVNDVDELPAFRGDLKSYLTAELEYPQSAKDDSVEGEVVVRFVINREGTPEQIKIEKGLSPDCDSAVVHMVREMPAWQPGKIDGFPVPVLVAIPVKFTLSEPDSASSQN